MVSLLDGHPPAGLDGGLTIMVIDPATRERLYKLLNEPELLGVNYSSFIERACEAAETEIAYKRHWQRVNAYAAENIGEGGPPR